MAFKLFRKNSDDEARNQRPRTQEPAPDLAPEEGPATGIRALPVREELPSENGLTDLVALMDRFKVTTLRLDQSGNEMTAVMDPSEKPERSTVVDTESSWFDAVARLYTTAQNSSSGPWRRAEIMVGSGHGGQRAVEVEYTYPDSQKQDREAYVQTLAGREDDSAAERDSAAGTADRGHQPETSTGAEAAAAAGADSAAVATAGGDTSEDLRGAGHHEPTAAESVAAEPAAESGRSEIGKTEYDRDAADRAGADRIGEGAPADAASPRTEAGKTEYEPAAVVAAPAGSRPVVSDRSAGEHPVDEPLSADRSSGDSLVEEPARTETVRAQDDRGIAERPSSDRASDAERERALEDVARDAERRQDPSEGLREPAGTAPAESEEHRNGTRAAVAGGATVVGTAAVVGAGTAASRESSDTEGSAQDSRGQSSDAGSGAQSLPGQDPAGQQSDPSPVAPHEPVPAVVDDADLDDSDALAAPASAGAVQDHRPSALPETAPSTAEHADVAPSFAAHRDPAAQASSTRLAPGNLVLTEADVLNRLGDAQKALFGAEGTARDVSTVLIRVRALGSYYDALTHVRTNGLWDQRSTFDLVPEEALHIPELKADSYQEGSGSPVAIMFRFTPGVPPQAEFDYADEEAFVKYADRLPAQQYIEELRLFPRTGANIPEHMNDALTQWTL